MALYFKTVNPQNLLNEFKKAIDSGKITTWSYDSDGDFTLTSDVWQYRAWLRPHIQNSKLEVFILPPKNSNISSKTYAIYHSRFIEDMLDFCDKYFSNSTITSFPEGNDNVKSDQT